MPYEIKLTDAFKTYTYDQDKVLSPEETIRRFKETIARVNLDILSRTIRIDTGRLDIPVFFSECGHDARKIIGTSKQMGKGGTPAQSEASAVMELVERFSFFSFVKNEKNFTRGTFREMGDTVPGYDQIIRSVHDDEEEALRVKPIFETLPLQWTRGFNLSTGREVLVPFNWFYMINEFNGPSAGNCPEEAVSQGICELVERHTSSLVSHGRINVPGIHLDSFTDPLVREMLAKYRNAGISVYASDFSLDTGISTIGLLAWDPATFPVVSEIVWTAGTAPDPQKAMSRALTETAQLAGDFISGSNYVASGLPKFTDIREAEFITHPVSMVSVDALPDHSHANIKTEVKNLSAALSENNLEVILIDTMHRQLKIPAFYCIIPGTHFRERAVNAGVGMFSARMITQSFEPAQALAKLSELDQRLPGKYYTHFYKGLCLLNQDEPEKAVRAFQTSLDLEPALLNIPDICSHMGAALRDLGKYEAALDVLARGIEIDDQRADIYNLMGFCHFKLKNHEAAIADFEKALKVDPSQAVNYANIGSNYRDMGKTDLAIRYYKKALEIDSSIEFARDSLDRLVRE